MLVVGLTGGMCCGKSTVSSMFAELGCCIIDADVISRKLVEPDQLVCPFGAPVRDDQAPKTHLACHVGRIFLVAGPREEWMGFL